jgi:uncharacterized protein YndB with AHSA1/START domain
MTEPQHAVKLVEAITVDAGAEDAFRTFTDELGRWWPKEYTWSGDVLEEMRIEPRVGGHCYEVGPHAFRCDWGRVTAVDAPHRIVFTWQISATRVPDPDPARGSEVEVRFDVEHEGSTLLTLEHRGFERHGDDGGQYCAAMASDAGWRRILQQYARHVRSA